MPLDRPKVLPQACDVLGHNTAALVVLLPKARLVKCTVRVQPIRSAD